MNTAVIVVIFVVALVLATGFLVLVLTLVPAINQLKSLLLDLERTSAEIRDMSRELKKMSSAVEERLEKVDLVLDSSRETVQGISTAFRFVNQNILKRAGGMLAFLPAIRLGWNLVKKIKGGKK